MAEGFNINKLKAEIDSRKTERTTKDVALGIVPAGAIPKKGKKAFLNELVTSMHRGVKTDASEAVRVLNETVEGKKGVPNAAAKNVNKYIPPRTGRVQLNEEAPTQQYAPNTAANDWGIPSGVAVGKSADGERDDLFEKQNAKYDQMMMSGNPIAAQIVKQPQQRQYVNEQQPIVMNESLDQMLNEKLERNMERMVESAFKSVLTSIYTKQKIQESLAEFLESDDFVKVVGKAINEIAKRNKAKQGK